MALIIHLIKDFDERLVPVRATKYREWWEDNKATFKHARHCLPLTMANSLGYYILSPATFSVEWNGNFGDRAVIDIHEKCSHTDIDDHAAFGSFAVQPKFIVETENVGDFVFIKGIPNERACPYSCMEAMIEAWWNPGIFGLVYLLNRPGKFTIYMGQPIAQMFVYKGEAGCEELQIANGYPPKTDEWQKRRNRRGYSKDLDYLKGKKPSGDQATGHITNWKDSWKYKNGH
jgi:hypothetical protein